MHSSDRARLIWTYGVAALMMLLITGLLWTFIPFFGVLRLADADPEVRRRLEDIAAYQVDPAALDLDDPAMATRRAALAPIFSRLDWVSIAALTSLLTFSCLGYFCGRRTGDPAWAGVLPLVSVIGQRNPAVMPTVMERQGFQGLSLSFPEQVGLVFFQMFVVYLFANWGAQVHGRIAESRATSEP